MFELVNFLCLKTKNIILFLDYDGTLTEIVNDPLQAKLTSQRRKLLLDLDSKDNIQLVINSGRSIEELDLVTEHLPIDFLANHGLFYKNKESKEIIRVIDTEILFTWDRKIGELKRYIQANFLPRFGKLWLQENIHGFVLHTRLMNPFDKNLLIIELDSLFKSKFQDIVYSDGKEIIEIKPVHLINKGKAVDWYLQKKHISIQDEKNILLIAIGDDKTDEDMFDKINDYKSGFGIKISQNWNHKIGTRTSAKIILDSVEKLYEFLNLINQISDKT